MVFAGYTRSHATLASDIQIYMFSSGMRISQCPRRSGTGGYSKDRRITGREISAPLWQMWQTVNRFFIAEDGSAITDIVGGEEALYF